VIGALSRIRGNIHGVITRSIRLCFKNIIKIGGNQMKWETLLFDVSGTVAVITFNRPTCLNAINKTLLCELDKVLDHCENLNDVRALVLTGGPKFFCSGGDVNESALIASPISVPY
jgi:1,4-dihydroxy-2-naphthoyl-CoA synthase